MKRLALLVLLVAGAAQAEPRHARMVVRNKPGVAASYTAIAFVAGVYSNASNHCTCSTSALTLMDSLGTPMTFTRSTQAWCTRSDGIILTCPANQPRLEPNGVLIEPPATNYAVYSNNIDMWSGASVTVTTNQGNGVGNTSTRERLVKSLTGNESKFRTETVDSGTEFTFSGYGRGFSATQTITIGVRCLTGGAIGCTCARSDGAACTPTILGGITCEVAGSFVSGGTINNARMEARLTCDAANTSILIYVAPGVPGVSGGDIFWGDAMLESGLSATSPIITGAGSSVARGGDMLQFSGLTYPLGPTYSAALTYKPRYAAGGVPRLLYFRNNAQTRGWQLNQVAGGLTRTGGINTTGANLDGPALTNNADNRIRGYFDGTTQATCVDGVCTTSAQTNANPVTFDTVDIGAVTGSTFNANGWLKSICVHSQPGRCI